MLFKDSQGDFLAVPGLIDTVQGGEMVIFGLFAMDPSDDGFGEDEIIHLGKQDIRSGETSLEFVVDRRPVRVGIDPYNKLIDRNSDDNLKAVGDGGS